MTLLKDPDMPEANRSFQLSVFIPLYVSNFELGYTAGTWENPNGNMDVVLKETSGEVWEMARWLE